MIDIAKGEARMLDERDKYIPKHSTQTYKYDQNVYLMNFFL